MYGDVADSQNHDRVISGGDDLLDGADHQMYAAKEGQKLSKGKAAGV